MKNLLHINEFAKIKENKFIVYHGSLKEFDIFDYQFLGTGNGTDQHGPGFYFSSDPEDAKVYGDVKKYEITINKELSKITKPKIGEIEKLIRIAPDHEDTLTNFGETYHQGFREAVKLMITDNNYDTMMNIWADFYMRQKQSIQFVKNLVNLKYDGTIIPMRYGVTHYVMYDINKISLLP